MVRRDESRTVYTSEAGRICPNCGMPIAHCQCKKQVSAPLGDGVVRVSLDKKGRSGKIVTLVTGLAGSEDTLRQIASDMKRRCSTGGTVKDGNIEIQGDHRDLLIEILKEKGIKAKRAGG
jgi:translation initiation factor 1